MEVSLNDLLREVAARGLTHLSLSPVASGDTKTTYWIASATPSTMNKYVSTTSKDPVEAVLMVLAACPKAPKRPPRKGDMLDVTAAVTPELDGTLRQHPWDAGKAAADAHYDPAPHSVPDPEPAKSEIDKWLPKT